MSGNLPEPNKKHAIFSRLKLVGGLAVETLAGAKTIDDTYGNFVKLDPGGAHRDVTLADVDDNVSGDFLVIVNSADAAENLVVKNSAGDTLATIGQNYVGIFMSNGGSDWAFVCKLSQLDTDT